MIFCCSLSALDSLYINCGGNELKIGSTRYESDTDRGGPANFYRGSNWAFSSTGNFMDDDPPVNIFFVENTSKLLDNSSELSMNARITPISLTYYGFCLMNGIYSVKLHFAEITFTNDKTYRSLGRRIFDVYIQGKLVLKEFNIEKEAGGVGIEIVTDFDVVVTSGTLEIRLYWSGKGTVGIPTRGVYGPLISAISVQLHGGRYFFLIDVI
ncbi:probable LRR receptor-like serine/threonine-protein kinase At1g07650 [Impatiens glandulifera]|uniref:probable LRR receptor-like serine/threonine-protein kinase At1g07650 n=1 Tax=Impatiens glandulifera TaxID=253017 RepID=UPI001FB09974|nr:probable LRR receptor-like serine/threonine-protein kinase At1g07650 [Impatiens glandulifera]